MKIKIIRNAVLCVILVVFVLPIYVLWVVFKLSALLIAFLAVFNYDFLRSYESKFCDFVERLMIQKQWRQRKKK